MAALGLIMRATVQAQQAGAAALDELNRVQAMMTDLRERENDLMQHRANLREIMEYCQQTLPKLDDAFRVVMMYAPPEQKPEIQRDYVEYRQNVLNVLVQAQLALSTPSPTPSPGQ